MKKLVATSNACLNFVLRSMKCIVDPFCEGAAKAPRKCLERYTDVILFVVAGQPYAMHPRKTFGISCQTCYLNINIMLLFNTEIKFAFLGDRVFASEEPQVIEYFSFFH